MPHESCPFAAPYGKKTDRCQRSAFSLRNLPFCAFDSRAQGFSVSLAHRQSNCPPPSPNLVRTHPIYQAFRDSAPCPSRAPTSRRAPNWSSEEAHLVNTILKQPYRRRVATDRLNRKDRPLAASFEGKPGPTSAGKILPHSDPKTRFRRERVQEVPAVEGVRGQHQQNQKRAPREASLDVVGVKRTSRSPTGKAGGSIIPVGQEDRCGRAPLPRTPPAERAKESTST